MGERAQTQDEFTCPHETLLAEKFGQKGDNGTFGGFVDQVNARLKRIERTADDDRREMKDEMTLIKATQTKLMVLVAVSASGGSAAAALAVKLLG